MLELEKLHQKTFQEQQELYNDKIKLLLVKLEINQAATPKVSATTSRTKKTSSKKSTATDTSEQPTKEK